MDFVTDDAFVKPASLEGAKVFTLLVERRCNSYCLFCGQREVDEALIRSRRRLNLAVPKSEFSHVHEHYTLETATEALRNARRDGFTWLSLQGGEPTVFPHLVPLVGAARTLGFTFIGMVTNGRKLADRAYAHALLQAGLDGMTFSLLGPDAETHDGLSAAPGSFDALCAGLRNVSELSRELNAKVSVSANIIVTSRNLDSLGAQIRVLASCDVHAATLHLVRFHHMGSDPIVRDMLRFDAARLPAALADAELAATECSVRLHADEVPFCLHPTTSGTDSWRLFDRASVVAHRFEGAGVRYGNLRPTPPIACTNCLLSDACVRVPDEHVGHPSPYRPITPATLTDALDAQLASLDPTDERSVASLAAQRQSILWFQQMVPVSDLTALRARVDEALEDLMLVAFSRRDPSALFTAAFALAGFDAPRDPLFDRASWDAVLADAGERLRDGAKWRGRGLVFAFGPSVELLIAGQLETPSRVRIDANTALRPVRHEQDARRRALLRPWSMVATGIARNLNVGGAFEQSEDRALIDRPGKSGVVWRRTREAIQSR